MDHGLLIDKDQCPTGVWVGRFDLGIETGVEIRTMANELRVCENPPTSAEKCNTQHATSQRKQAPPPPPPPSGGWVAVRAVHVPTGLYFSRPLTQDVHPPSIFQHGLLGLRGNLPYRAHDRQPSSQ